MMQNPGLVGVHHAGNFNLRSTGMVVLCFGIITIISYFNELSKAGLLSHRNRMYLPRSHRSIRDVPHDQPDFEKLYRQELRLRSLGVPVAGDGHKEKNDTLPHKENSSMNRTMVVDFKSTMHNYFLNMELPLNFTHPENVTVEKVLRNLTVISDFLSREKKRRLQYQNKAVILFSLQSAEDYVIQDCVKSVAGKDLKSSKVRMPFNESDNQNWGVVFKKIKNKLQILYGDMPFGVCEGYNQSCTYLALMTHPLDRILTLYHLCRKHPNQTLCQRESLNVTNVSLKDFVKSQGSTLLRRLLHNSKYCNITDKEKLCSKDPHQPFVISEKDLNQTLPLVLSSLQDWFAVVGVAKQHKQYLKQSDLLLGPKYSGCLQENPVFNNGEENRKSLFNSDHFTSQKTHILKSPELKKWIRADLAVYNKAVEIFSKQQHILELYKKIQHIYGRVQKIRLQAGRKDRKGKKYVKKDVLKNTEMKTNHTKFPSVKLHLEKEMNVSKAKAGLSKMALKIQKSPLHNTKPAHTKQRHIEKYDSEHWWNMTNFHLFDLKKGDVLQTEPRVPKHHNHAKKMRHQNMGR